MKFSNSYSQLGNAFYYRVTPTAVTMPNLLLWNENLAESLQINELFKSNSHLKSLYFSGNKLPEGADPLALAYSGHQFGHFNPNLGDGRAHLLGELIDKDNQRVDIQLKGSGPTPFSRQGDGRCAIGPAIREYIMSEAMFYLRVPTSRCLAVVSSGETVYRDTPRPGAIVTRVASSHIRVGTFQYFSSRQDLESLQQLLDYSIDRHFPEIQTSENNRAVAFLQATINKQIQLVVEWMRVGFIHGVMNTDNMTVSGETIDYGPCAMMGKYDPATVYSSIDRNGRYAFANQPSIALWNMTRLAESLLPLIDDNTDAAVAVVEPLLNQFAAQFKAAYETMLGNKLGFNDSNQVDSEFYDEFLKLMHLQSLDYTLTFTQLTQSLNDAKIASELEKTLGSWYKTWRKKIDLSADDASELMGLNNPLLIPRNHHLEAVLADCEKQQNSQAAEDFLKVLRSPYQELPTTIQYQKPPRDGDQNYQTFCGT